MEAMNDKAVGLERIRQLLKKAETLDADAIETLPGIVKEIRAISGAQRYMQGEIESLLLLARYHAMKDDYTEAVRLAGEADQKFALTGDTAGRVKALGILGFCHAQIGRTDTALGHFLRALQLIRDNSLSGPDVEDVRGNILNNLASIYGDMGRYEEALNVLREVQKQAEPAGGAPLVMALENMCEAYLKSGDLVKALVCNQRALVEIKTKNLGSTHLCQCHSSFGMIYEQSGQLQKARTSYLEALEAAEKAGNRFYQAKAELALGGLEWKMKDGGAAAESLKQALKIAGEIGANELLASAHGLLTEIAEAKGEYQSAFLHLKSTVEIDKALETGRLEHTLSNYAADMKIRELEKDAEIYKLRNVELRQTTEELAQKARELEQSYRNIKTIGEIGQKITNSLDVENVLNTIYESVNTLMDAGIFAIGLYEAAMDTVDYKMLIAGSQRQPLFQVAATDERSIAAQVIRAGGAVIFGGEARSFTENTAMQWPAGETRRPRSAIGCPLMLSDRITGVLIAQSYEPDAYSQRTCETMLALASYIVIALNNSQQSEELKAKARELELASRTDVLTGLFNRRHIMEKIEEERIRYMRSGRPFSIVICDIDHFKKINDVHGHDCGDETLKSLAALLGRHIRKQDCLARWGGEEFLMLLPETDAQGASVLAEKLRKRVEEHEFAYAGLRLAVTMTFGVAQYNREYGVDACIVGADSALYKGKSSGRNRVVVF